MVDKDSNCFNMDEDIDVPEFHKAIVRERLLTYKDEKQYNWEEIKDQFELDNQ
ncbi:hypothetical protein BH09BAC1_BH09BAC1_26410 [soil metagenome]